MGLLSGSKLKRLLLLILQQVPFYLGAEAVTEVFVRLGDMAKLPCDAPGESQVQYRALSWYKVGADGFSLSGIIRMDFKQNIVWRYLGFNGSVAVNSTSPYFLTIYNVSDEDLGTYQCIIWAPLGEQNKDGNVKLQKISEANQFERITRNMLIFIVMAMCLPPILCMYLVYKKYSGRIETCVKEMSKTGKCYSWPFGNNVLSYTNIQC
ncbi:CD83 antigen-like isoform X2 [Hemiscyllium ocellatum]|uniref:CD83 antigen-like isoform X2 n=1 Tax=Hemiscyllium ocellatum TaxID=170820 RepID=UPI002966D7D4|nr:CD83 antigen-like isoform X2 [Hemiscyllium ocellatum]